IQIKKDVLAKKIENDAKLAAVKLELKEGATEFRARRKGIARDRLSKLRQELVYRKTESQRMQLEISNISALLRNGAQKSLAESFMEAARGALPPETFEDLLEKARWIRDGLLPANAPHWSSDPAHHMDARTD